MDTISFRINKNKFTISDFAQFSPEFSKRPFSELSAKEVRLARIGKLPYLKHFILRPEPVDDLYLPRVEIYEKANLESTSIDYELIITLSLPKFLFGNNFQEISPSDHKVIIHELSERLSNMGVNASPYAIDGAPISVVHFCKNIILQPNHSIRSILAELSKVDIGKAYDTTDDVRCKDKNNSETLHLRCGTREWSFYDKVEDLKRPKSKSEDKEKTTHEKELIQTCNLEGKEVFRYEYRLNKAQTIRSEINKEFGKPYETSVIFADLFSEGLWKKVLQNSWKKIVTRPENQLALISPNSKLDLFLHILQKAKQNDKSGHSQNQALWSYGLAVAIQDHGVKAVRKELEKIWSNKADERLNKKITTAAALIIDIPPSNGILHIGKGLNDFERITLTSLENGI